MQHKKLHWDWTNFVGQQASWRYMDAMLHWVPCQGYDIDEYIIFQDDMSALLLEKNGRISSSTQIKHIKTKYFFIKDYYDAGEIDVKFCPTDEMWADVLTKPLRGQKFRDMRAFLQNCPRDYNDDTEFKLSMKPQDVASLWECVDEHAKLKPILKTKQSSQPRATSPTCVSRVTWGPTQVSWTPDESHKRSHKEGSHKDNRSEGSCKVQGIPQTHMM
jgi:hypothetical protein